MGWEHGTSEDGSVHDTVGFGGRCAVTRDVCILAIAVAVPDERIDTP